MAYTKMGLFLIVLLISSVAGRSCDSSDDGSWFWKAGAGLTAGVLAVVAAPVVVPLEGFGAGGIAAGSLAAGAMSTAATTGVGMAAVSTLQAVGATGALTLAQATVVGGGTTAGVYKALDD